MKPNRNRPVLHTTIGDYTLAILAQVAKEVALPNFGVTVDYIVNDWVDLKKTALQAAVAADPADKNVFSPVETPA